MIIKANQEENLYLLWSHQVDSPIFIGTRGELTEYLLEEARDKELAKILKSFESADLTGTSSRLKVGSWEDEEIHVGEGAPVTNKIGSYYLERARITEYAKLLLKNDEASAQSILIFKEDE